MYLNDISMYLLGLEEILLQRVFRIWFCIPVLDWVGKYLCSGRFYSIGNQLIVDSYRAKVTPYFHWCRSGGIRNRVLGMGPPSNNSSGCCYLIIAIGPPWKVTSKRLVIYGDGYLTCCYKRGMITRFMGFSMLW